MKFSVCFLLSIVSWVAALPAEIPSDASLELDLSKIFPMNVYVEPEHPVDESSLPGGRIIGGEEVEPNSVPYQVALLVNGGGLCGGSLISTTRVLTAAHCTSGASFVNLHLGAHQFIQNEETQVRLTSTSILVHPTFNLDSFLKNDISVIFLPSAIVPNANVQVIPLAPANAGSFAWSSAFLTGWGLTSDANDATVSPVLRGVGLDILPNGACAAIFGTVVLESNICTSGAGVVGGCNGDSGGPLVVDGVQVGLVSFGAASCESRNPTVHARISEFREWIRENADV